MKTWLHRVSHHAEASYPLLSRGYLTVGYSDFSSPEFIVGINNRSDGAGWQYFEEEFDKCWGKRPRGRHALWKFLVEMKSGDRVLVPKHGGLFSIYEIVDDSPLSIREVEIAGLRPWGLADGDEIAISSNGLLTHNGKELDLGFARRVRPLKEDIERGLYADAALTSRMKIWWATSDISDLNESVEQSLNAESPINLHATLLEKHIETTLQAVKEKLNPDKFEKLVKWYLQHVGATHAEQLAKNESGKEGDADVVATFDPIRTIIYVQAKFQDGVIGDWSVDQIISYRDHKKKLRNENGIIDNDYARIGWVVSTADDFTPECKARAKDSDVLLLNGKRFVELLLNAGIEGLDTAV